MFWNAEGFGCVTVLVDSGGLVVGYLNKKDIAEVVKPLEA